MPGLGVYIDVACACTDHSSSQDIHACVAPHVLWYSMPTTCLLFCATPSLPPVFVATSQLCQYHHLTCVQHMQGGKDPHGTTMCCLSLMCSRLPTTCPSPYALVTTTSLMFNVCKVAETLMTQPCAAHPRYVPGHLPHVAMPQHTHVPQPSLMHICPHPHANALAVPSGHHAYVWTITYCLPTSLTLPCDPTL